MMSTHRWSDTLALVNFERQLRNLIHAIAYSHDWLDYTLLGSLWEPSGIVIDTSDSLPEETATKQPVGTLLATVRSGLSGYEATRHFLSNVVVKFDRSASPPLRAEILAQLYAVHSVEGMVVSGYTSWKISAVRMCPGKGVPQEQQAKVGNMGDWVADGIWVDRAFPLVGSPRTCRKAIKRAGKRVKNGKGRPGSGTPLTTAGVETSTTTL